MHVSPRKSKIYRLRPRSHDRTPIPDNTCSIREYIIQLISNFSLLDVCTPECKSSATDWIKNNLTRAYLQGQNIVQLLKLWGRSSPVFGGRLQSPKLPDVDAWQCCNKRSILREPRVELNLFWRNASMPLFMKDDDEEKGSVLHGPLLEIWKYA